MGLRRRGKEEDRQGGGSGSSGGQQPTLLDDRVRLDAHPLMCFHSEARLASWREGNEGLVVVSQSSMIPSTSFFPRVLFH